MKPLHKLCSCLNVPRTFPWTVLVKLEDWLNRPILTPWNKWRRAYETLDRLYLETVHHIGELDQECSRLRRLSNCLIGEKADIIARNAVLKRELESRRNLELKLARAQQRILELEKK